MTEIKIKRETYLTKVTKLLESTEVGETFCLRTAVVDLWEIDEFDYFVGRSFDVYYCKAKKELTKKGYEFSRGDFKITRVK